MESYSKDASFSCCQLNVDSETLQLNTDLTVHAYTAVGLKRIVRKGYLVMYLQSFYHVPCIHVAREE